MDLNFEEFKPTMRGEPKPCCGSTGTRHMKNCPVVTKSVAKAEPDPQSRVTLTGEQYIELRKAMHDREFQSAKYALINKLSPREVNRAVVTKDYQEYMSSD